MTEDQFSAYVEELENVLGDIISDGLVTFENDERARKLLWGELEDLSE